jgi:hypothetical protein
MPGEWTPVVILIFIASVMVEEKFDKLLAKL